MVWSVLNVQISLQYKMVVYLTVSNEMHIVDGIVAINGLKVLNNTKQEITNVQHICNDTPIK